MTVEPIRILYRNWHGEVAIRRIQPHAIAFGCCEWHPEPQWLIHAFDADKQADRTFAVKDILAINPPADDAEPTTPEFVRADLPPTSDHGKRGMHFGPLGEIEWYENWGEFHVWYNNRRLKLDGLTRGQFRALCRGLGVPLAEVSAG